jgi:hypothetical protein
VRVKRNQRIHIRFEAFLCARPRFHERSVRRSRKVSGPERIPPKLPVDSNTRVFFGSREEQNAAVGVDVSTCSERDTNSIANALNVSSARNKWDTERRQNYIHGPRCRAELERSLIVERVRAGLNAEEDHPDSESIEIGRLQSDKRRTTTTRSALLRIRLST